MTTHPLPALDTTRPLRGSVELTISGTFTAGERTILHRQYVSEHFVVTEFEGALAIYAPSLGARFQVDRRAGLLRPMSLSAHRAQLEHLREVLGVVAAERSDRVIEVDGYPCRLHTLRNEAGRISIVAEAWCTCVAGVERTALLQERAFDARIHPFSLPLAPDEVVVRSVMRTVANGIEQRQTYRLRDLEHGIEEPERLEEYLAYPVAGA